MRSEWEEGGEMTKFGGGEFKIEESSDSAV